MKRAVKVAMEQEQKGATGPVGIPGIPGPGPHLAGPAGPADTTIFKTYDIGLNGGKTHVVQPDILGMEAPNHFNPEP